MSYNKITKADAKKLNVKQTILVEKVLEGEKETINVYLNNSRKRSEAFTEMYSGNFKPSKKKDEIQKSYRLLKLHKLFDEIGNKGAKEGVFFFQSETYKADPEPKAKAAAETAAPVAEEQAA